MAVSAVLRYQARAFPGDLLTRFEASIGRANGADFALGVFHFVSGFREAGCFLNRAAGKESGAGTDQCSNGAPHGTDHQPGHDTDGLAGGGIRHLTNDLIGHTHGREQQEEGER